MADDQDDQDDDGDNIEIKTLPYQTIQEMIDSVLTRDMDFEIFEQMSRQSIMYGRCMGKSFMVRNKLYHEIYGAKAPYVIVDEYYEPEDKSGHESDGPKKLYWHQPIPKTKGKETPPSQSKRAKLRTKRKGKKKK